MAIDLSILKGAYRDPKDTAYESDMNGMYTLGSKFKENKDYNSLKKLIQGNLDPSSGELDYKTVYQKLLQSGKIDEAKKIWEAGKTRETELQGDQFRNQVLQGKPDGFETTQQLLPQAGPVEANEMPNYVMQNDTNTGKLPDVMGEVQVPKFTPYTDEESLKLALVQNQIPMKDYAEAVKDLREKAVKAKNETEGVRKANILKQTVDQFEEEFKPDITAAYSIQNGRVARNNLISKIGQSPNYTGEQKAALSEYVTKSLFPQEHATMEDVELAKVGAEQRNAAKERQEKLDSALLNLVTAKNKFGKTFTTATSLLRRNQSIPTFDWKNALFAIKRMFSDEAVSSGEATQAQADAAKGIYGKLNAKWSDWTAGEATPEMVNTLLDVADKLNTDVASMYDGQIKEMKNVFKPDGSGTKPPPTVPPPTDFSSKNLPKGGIKVHTAKGKTGYRANATSPVIWDK